MKNLFLILLLTIFGTVASAAIVPGTYSGVVKYSVGSNKKSYTKKRDVNVYVQLADPQVTDLAYGLVLDEDVNQAALYRIEELPDQTQLWIQIYQGQNNVLKVNESATPDFTGTTIGGNRLILRPSEERIRCGESELDVVLSNGSQWLGLPKESITYKMKNGTYSTYDVDTFKGTVTLNGALYSGVLHLTPVLPRVASLRRSVVDQKALSGYRQEKRIVGIVTNISSKRNNLLFIGMPEGKRQCSYGAQLLRNE